MFRSLLAWISIGLVVVAAGCRMCAHPYDYWGPVLTDGCPAEGGRDARAGSILSGVSQPIVEGPLAPEAIMTPEPELAPDVEMSPSPTAAPPSGAADIDFGVDPKMIISVTDRKAGEPGESSAQPTEARPRRSLNWTTPRPIEEATEEAAAGGGQ